MGKCFFNNSWSQNNSHRVGVTFKHAEVWLGGLYAESLTRWNVCLRAQDVYICFSLRWWLDAYRCRRSIIGRELYVIDGSDSQLSKDVSFRKADGGRCATSVHLLLTAPLPPSASTVAVGEEHRETEGTNVMYKTDGFFSFWTQTPTNSLHTHSHSSTHTNTINSQWLSS